MTVEAPICMECRHYNRDDDEKLSCAAFPNGIPDDIIEGVVVHMHHVKGDHGIMFEQRTP